MGFTAPLTTYNTKHAFLNFLKKELLLFLSAEKRMKIKNLTHSRQLELSSCNDA